MQPVFLFRHLTLIVSLAIVSVLALLRIMLFEYAQMIYFIVFYISLGLAFNVFLGFTNYVCFGYSVFIALGGYAMAHAIKWFAGVLNPPLVIAIGLLLAILYALILALITGFIGLRLKEAYFAIATIGLAQGVRFFIEGFHVWGGSEGLIVASNIIAHYGSKWLSTISIDYADLLMFLTAILSILITYYLLNSRARYAFMAIKEDEDVARSFGVNSVKYKLLAFSISGILGALLGVSKLLKDQAIFPGEAFSLTFTLEALVITLVGGKGTLMFPLVLGILYAGLKYFLTTMFPGLQLLIFAVIVIVVVELFPEGVAGWLRRRYKGTLIEKIIT